MELGLLNRQVDGLDRGKTWVFGAGHLLNDFAGALWFNYGLFYLANVQGVSEFTAGFVMLIGQITDACSTPILGLLSDKYDSRLGKRVPWYIFGTVLMPLSFFFLFQDCYIGKGVIEVVWYSFFAVLFNIGWAAIQMAHMSLIPAITPVKEKKDFIIGIRTAFTYIANIVVLTLALLLFTVMSDSKAEFIVLVACVLGAGIIVNTLFCFVIKEKKLTGIVENNYKSIEDSERSSRHWMREAQLYWVALMYVSARLANNYTTTMAPFYIAYVLEFGGAGSIRTSWHLAVIPLVLYLSSVISSLVFSKIPISSRKTQFLIGLGFTLVGGISLLFLGYTTRYLMLISAILLGTGFSFTLNSSIAQISAYVGSAAKSGAVVWGIMGFADKFSSGAFIFLTANIGNLEGSLYIRTFTVGVLLGTTVLGVLSIIYIRNIHEFTKKEVEMRKM